MQLFGVMVMLMGKSLAVVRGKLLPLILLAALLAMPASSMGQQQDRMWLSWEHIGAGNCGTAQNCPPDRTFASQLVSENSADEVFQTFRELYLRRRLQGLPPTHPDTPRYCEEGLIPTTEEFRDLPVAEARETLRGLPGVYFSVRQVAVPETFSRDGFHDILHTEVAYRLKQGGVRILTEQERRDAPGRPMLKLTYKAGFPNITCPVPYRVSLALKQTSVLTRDITIKLEGTTWSASAGASHDFPDDLEYDTMLRVIDRFIDDYRKANNMPALVR